MAVKVQGCLGLRREEGRSGSGVGADILKVKDGTLVVNRHQWG